MTDTITQDGTQYKVITVNKDTAHNYVDKIRDMAGKKLGYTVKENIGYYSPRYLKWVLIKAGTKSDGATQAKDIDSFGWLFHDQLCATGEFSCGDKCNNLQASTILSDILSAEHRWFRSITWFAATWLIGSGKARKNGMI